MQFAISLDINGSVAERSKAADSSSVIVRCACSNHAGVIIFKIIFSFNLFLSLDFNSTTTNLSNTLFIIIPVRATYSPYYFL